MWQINFKQPVTAALNDICDELKTFDDTDADAIQLHSSRTCDEKRKCTIHKTRQALLISLLLLLLLLHFITRTSADHIMELEARVHQPLHRAEIGPGSPDLKSDASATGYKHHFKAIHIISWWLNRQTNQVTSHFNTCLYFTLKVSVGVSVFYTKPNTKLTAISQHRNFHLDESSNSFKHECNASETTFSKWNLYWRSLSLLFDYHLYHSNQTFQNFWDSNILQLSSSRIPATLI